MTLTLRLLWRVLTFERNIMSALENLNAAVTAMQKQQTDDSALVQQVLTSIQELKNELNDGPALQSAADAITAVVASMQSDAAALTQAIAPAP